MAGKLATLIRLHRFRLDEERRALVAVERRRQQYVERLDALAAEITAEQQSAGRDAEIGFAYAAFARAAIERRRALETEITAAEAEAEQLRERLKTLYRALRPLELAEEARLAGLAAEADRRERLMLDEIALLARGDRTGGAAGERR